LPLSALRLQIDCRGVRGSRYRRLSNLPALIGGDTSKF
jgi:hypothetical protein